MHPVIAGLPGIIAIFAGDPTMAQYGSRAVDAPKVQFFAPAPDAPVAPVIVPPRETAPAESAPMSPAPATTPPTAPARPQAVRPPPASSPSSQAPYFVPGARNSAPVAPTASDPSTTAEVFYRTYVQIRTSGVPDATQRARLRPFLTPALEAALAAAEQAERSHRAKTNGAVPPLVEGDMFASLFEGANAFKVQECSERPPGMQCHLQLSFTDPSTKQKVEWRDTLLLVRLGGNWRVNDIVYGGKFAFGQTGQLTELLQIVVKEGKE